LVKKGEVLEGEKLVIKRMKFKIELWKEQGYDVRELERKLEGYLNGQ